MKTKDLVLLSASCIFLPLLPLLDIIAQYIFGKPAAISPKEHGVPAILSVIILGVAIGVSFVDIYEESVVDTVAFLNRVLSFLLPLNLTACIAKNKLGLSKFRSMCMEFQEVAWQVHGLNKGKEDESYNKIMTILKYLPEIIKHDIRKDTNEESVDTNLKKYITGRSNISYQLLKQVHEEIAELSKSEKKTGAEKKTGGNEGGNKVPEQVTEKNASVNVPSVNNLFRGMNKAVAFLSEIQSIQSYLLPDLFFGFFYLVILVYFTLLPISIIESGIDCAWKCYVQLYVFMGMFFVGLYVQNAFRSSKTAGLQTVSEIHKKHVDKFNLAVTQVATTTSNSVFELYSDNLFTKRYY